MAETISMPKLGFDMREGVLVRWVKNEGDTINKGDVLAEIETDKATVEVESTAAGVVRKLLASQGDAVPVGAPIAIVGSADEKIDAPSTEGSKPKAEEPKAESKEQKTESSTQKAEEKPAAPAAATKQAAPAPVPVQAAAPAPQSGPVKASPLAKKIALDNHLDLTRVQGSGPGGRVVRRDIEAALTTGLASKTNGRPATIVSRQDQVVQTTKLRQAIGRRLVESKTTIPHFYVTHEYKMEALMDARRQINSFVPENEKVSVNDFILKAVALTLRQFPNLNATINGDKVTQFGHVNVGVAVTVPGGLMTVVVKDTDQKSLSQISGEVKTMAGRAREGKVKTDDVDGSTFSTSNLGMYDVEDFIAIINPPEAAILAISSAREVPVVENGMVKPGWRMKATISVDHRVSDGAEAAQFMQALAGFIENPVRMLI
jgi:pyruvate dehydrogenase E2 component (dihydrolipoamide acetyltransferase)